MSILAIALMQISEMTANWLKAEYQIFITQKVARISYSISFVPYFRRTHA
jgi:hypothetical protein